MSPRFDEVRRLAELEKKATPAKWYKAEEDEGDRELGVFHPTKEKRRVSESEYEEVDNPLTVCSPEQESDANLIANLRNAARWLTEVARCFQRGDADEIAYARDVLASDSRYTGDLRVWTRLLRAAKIMEERE
jgi:hypothetical protein